MANDKENFDIYLFNVAYNIKKFMSNHPGGTSLLNNMKNQEVDKKMEKYEHSKFAYRLLQDYRKEVDINGNNDGYHNLPEIDPATKEIINQIKELQDIESLVDWSKPMLSQLDKLGSNYALWVQTPVDKKLRMFNSPLLESMTFTPWYIVPIVWIPIICFFYWHSYSTRVACGDSCTEPPMTIFLYILYIFSGILLWTFIEYTLHRWIFHCNPGNSLFLKQFHFLIHGLHHKVPFDNMRQVFPPIPAMVLSFGIYLILSILFPNPFILVTGGITGYLIYDMIHFYIHYGSPKAGTFLYDMKRYHANHHFIDPSNGFGISSKLWDDVFETKTKLKTLGFNLSWN